MRAGAGHFLRKPEHVVLVMKGDRVHHTYRQDQAWTLGNVEALNEEPPF